MAKALKTVARKNVEDRDENLDALAYRLDERGEAAEQAKDMTLTVEMYAAAHAVRAADHFMMALAAMDAAHLEWGKIEFWQKRKSRGR